MKKYLFFLLVTNLAFAQTVSTFLEDPDIDVDDALIFDGDGNLYGSNFAGDTVYKITPEGEATPFITGLLNPNGLAFDTAGNFFAVDWGAGEVLKHDSDGNLLETYEVGPTPSGLIATPTGTVIYTDTNENSIKEIAKDGTITTLFTGDPLNAPVGLAYDENDVLYIGNFVGREVYRFTGTDVAYVATVPDGGTTTNDFLGFITYAEGYLYGTNFGGHQIYKINPTAVDDVILFAGSDAGSMDGDIADATFSFTNGIIYNPSQQALYISEFSGVGNIRRIDDFVLSLDEQDATLEFSVAPNPASNELYLDFGGSINFEGGTLSIYQASGSLVARYKDFDQQTLDVSQLASGIYFVEIISEKERKWVARFMKD